jgi:hypothetical protein
LEYSCLELTHKGEESSVEFRIKPASDSKNGPNGLLLYTIRARNLPDPVSKQFGVSFALIDEDTFALAKSLIETGIPENTAGI